ncbi:methylenetetrahydrofolate reductase [NAD(P)H] [Psychrobacter sp. I-STPA6b]|uniref:methylenetetrahydrofolate reductase [NAD(P)H] n=1 Tax=Psychrobacter sp. I-STPA6b TaxID=2585718 RepID=UPI001D0CC003|nr:methylenetetrahydrofolate reductase [NAD(P)H] [Psychrobacter sp. I-STPA6b]
MTAKPTFSFEFYPPKTSAGQEKLGTTFDELNALSPSYFSVTYGAGGSTRERTLDTINMLKKHGATDIAPHISCIGDDKSQIAELLEYYQSIGISRLVALRGDLPSGQVGMGELPFARDLVAFIREQTGDAFYIEVAAYPEMHPQARSFASDVQNLVNKYQAGANAAITQFFFNADSYLYLRDALEKQGIDTQKQPLIAGIMPITSSSSLVRFADSCGADIPRYVRKQLTDFGDDRKAIREFGFEVVYKLCERLIAESVPALHFYTMNKTEPNRKLVKALGLQ